MSTIHGLQLAGMGRFQSERRTRSFLAFFDFELALVSSASTKALNSWDCQTGMRLTMLPSVENFSSDIMQTKCPSISLIPIAVGGLVYVLFFTNNII